MTLTLRVLAPDQSVFDGTADEVILPGTTGQLGILTGHVSMLTALDSGVLRVREGGNWQS
ncbi:F0F1 ATP synthase subunit epsilon, partial [Synechococcus sp. BA-132 BA5]|nr:F0F1 ATP synthase subunit epsilon [Synechococcus sp. BA-132 BA5]